MNLWKHSANLKKAFQFAIEKHDGQKYGALDYSYHLEEVANKVVKLFPTQDHAQRETLIIVAYLHDVLEDTSCTFIELQETFGDEVAIAVDLMTKKGKVDYIDGQSLEGYVQPLSKNWYALRGKIADCWSNLEHSMAEKNYKRVYKYTRLLNRLFEHLTYQNLFE